jgi:hypothetical protein
MNQIQIPESLLDCMLYREKLVQSGVPFKSAHRCNNCNNEFDCSSWDCDETDDVYCTIKCSEEYNLK